MAKGKQPGGPAKGQKAAKGKKPAKAAKGNKPAKAAPAKRSAARGGNGSGAATATAAATRAERLSAARRQRQRRALFLRLGIGAATLVVIGVVVFLNAGSQSSTRSVIAELTSGPGECEADTRFDGSAREQEQHIAGPRYSVDPPAGGPHEPSAAAPGFYNPDNVPSDGKLVHAMEHGFVVLWYRPDLAREDLEELERLSDRFGRELIVAPRASLEGEVAVTSWHRRLLCQNLDPEAIALYTDTFKDQGREKGFL